MTEVADKSLPEKYREYMEICIDDDGVSLPHGLILTNDGFLTVLALAVPPHQAYDHMIVETFKQLPCQSIFALDRFTKPDQGTKYGDLLAGHYFDGSTFRPFIIEYQISPRIVDPVCWNNQFWNEALIRELRQSQESLMRRSK